MLKQVLSALAITAIGSFAVAQDTVTLKLHQFLPATANVPANVLRPWATEIEAASGGRLKIEFYDAMVLGGKPADLFDQAKDGVVDMIQVLPGYTPGRFPRTETFELPFLMKDPTAASRALMQMITEDFAANEYADVHVLGAWVHGPGVLHANKPVTKLEDMNGLQVRAPTRLAGELLTTLGATAVGLPLPAVPENLTKGVINGALIPWDVTPSIKLVELVKYHTELEGPEAIYTATLILVMNKDSYAALPDDLRAILDAKSGDWFAEFAGRTEHSIDPVIRAEAVQLGNSVVTLDAAETARWKAAAEPVRAAWIAEMTEKGIDGAALIARAEELMAKFGG
jgi:TRAP-type transport system periplasmic protein